MPEPLAHHSGDGYRVRIVEVGTEEYRCSDDFYLMDSGDAPVAGEAGGGYIEVLSPTSHSVAMAGETYTVEVRREMCGRVFCMTSSFSSGGWGDGESPICTMCGTIIPYFIYLNSGLGKSPSHNRYMVIILQRELMTTASHSVLYQSNSN